MPLFKEMNPRFIEAAIKTADLTRRDDEYLFYQAVGYIDSEFLSINRLNSLPYPIASRVIRQKSSKSLSHEHVSAIIEMCRSENPSAHLRLPGVTAYREYNKVFFKRNENIVESEVEERGFEPIHIKNGDVVFIPEAGLKIFCTTVMAGAMKVSANRITTFNKTFNTFLFHVDEICGTMTVRPRREGDSIKLFGSNHTKKLKKLFIERRIPRLERNQIPVICDDEGVLGVYGLGRSNRALPSPGDYAIKIEIISM
jgi:tRNA(Ile)-lysidine synthase